MEGKGGQIEGREYGEKVWRMTKRESGKEGGKESSAVRAMVVGVVVRCLLSCRSCGGFLGMVEVRERTLRGGCEGGGKTLAMVTSK